MTDCKIQILNTLPDNSCCSQAFINVALLSAQISADRSTLILNVPQPILDRVIKITSSLYPNLEINCWDSFLMLKGNVFDFLLSVEFNNTIDLKYFVNECDRLTLLKSFFLFFGRFYYNEDNNINSKGYNLEFVLKDDLTALVLQELLKEKGFELKKIKRFKFYVVYTKNSNVISDLFVLLGAQYTAMEIQNNLAIREMRNNINRQNNCFESNLDKTLSASEIQLEAINYIISHHSIDYLEENLKVVALMRLANPDISLNELKTLLGGKISRAGIKYRLDKIIDIYKKLKND